MTKSVVCVTNQINSTDARWHNVSFHRCCYHKAAFEITSNKVTKTSK